jgi:glycosyltransferase involved in cell wall biosynthesis
MSRSRTVQLGAENTTDAGTARPIRVLAFFESYGIMGASKPVLEFAQQAALEGNRRAEVSTLLYVRRKEENPLIDLAQGRGIPLDIVDERYAWDWQTLRQLRAVVEKRRPDVIWTSNSKSHFLVRFLGLHRDAAWVAFHQGHTTVALRTRLYHQLDWWSLRAANRVVAVCNSFANDLQRRGVPARRISVQHNPIRFTAPASAEEKERVWNELDLPPGARVLLSVGRLSLEKGHAELLRAMARLREEGQGANVYMVMVGSGPQRDALLALSSQLGLDDVVRFCGQKTDVRPYYGIADAFVLPSHSEGSPNVVLEALAAELPIVATAVGGVPELLTHEENALLVPRKDVAQMAAEIGRILNDRALCKGFSRKAREVAARYESQAYFQNVLDIFEEVSTRPRQAAESR